MKYNSKTIEGRIKIYEDLLEGYLSTPYDDENFSNGMCYALKTHLCIPEEDAYSMPEIYKYDKFGRSYWSINARYGQRDVRIAWLEKTIEELKSKLSGVMCVVLPIRWVFHFRTLIQGMTQMPLWSVQKRA
jgi:hypothetical protein